MAPVRRLVEALSHRVLPSRSVQRALTLCFALTPSLVPAHDAVAQDAPVRFVQVSAIKMRKQPQHWAAGTNDLKYGETVTVLSEQGAWVRARTESGQEGFLPISAVTLKKVVLSDSSAPVKIRADDSDIVLAGKGFNEGLEEALGASDVSYDFDAVDTAEKNSPTDDRVIAFIRTGELAQEVD